MNRARLLIGVIVFWTVQVPVYLYAAHPMGQQVNSSDATHADRIDARNSSPANEDKIRETGTRLDKHGHSVANKSGSRNRFSVTQPKHIPRPGRNSTNSKGSDASSHAPLRSLSSTHAYQNLTNQTRARPIRSSGLGGQPVQSHNRTAMPASLGGPYNARRNVAGLNGTTIARKHTN